MQAVRKIQSKRVDDEPTLSQMVERAGELKDESTGTTNTYNAYRKELEKKIQLQIPKGSKPDKKIESDHYIAKYVVGTGKRVKMGELMKAHPKIFAQLASIAVKDLEDVLGTVMAQKFIEVVEKQTPVLTISSKPKTDSEKVKEDFRSVA